MGSYIPLYKQNSYLAANLTIPINPKALIIFTHVGGSGKSSPRNEYVSSILNENGFATLLVDLLSPEEQQTDIRKSRGDV